MDAIILDSFGLASEGHPVGIKHYNVPKTSLAGALLLPCGNSVVILNNN